MNIDDQGVDLLWTIHYDNLVNDVMNMTDDALNFYTTSIVSSGVDRNHDSMNLLQRKQSEILHSFQEYVTHSSLTKEYKDAVLQQSQAAIDEAINSPWYHLEDSDSVLNNKQPHNWKLKGF